MTNPAPLTQGEDTAKKVDDINKLLEVVDRCQKVVKEGRERHVQIWDCFIRNNAEAPSNANKHTTQLIKGWDGGNLKLARLRSWSPHPLGSGINH